jgi:hypothetical protein
MSPFIVSTTRKALPKVGVKDKNIRGVPTANANVEKRLLSSGQSIKGTEDN